MTDLLERLADLPTPLVLLVPLFNERRRCLHDYLCGTVFVRRSV